MRLRPIVTSAALLLISSICFGQGVVTPRRHQTSAEQTGATALPPALPVSAIKINAHLNGQLAIVRVEHLFRNDTDETLEGTYYFPVPEGATLLEFAVYDGDTRRVGRVKEKQEARAAYSQAAAQGEDPAILEMTRRGWFQSRIYPILPRSDKRVDIIYSHIITEKDGTAVFEYPLGKGYQKLRVPVGEVEIQFDVQSAAAIKNVFSPTHPIDLQWDGERHATGAVKTVGGEDAENFKLAYSLSEEEVSASLITHRREGEDGYFLLMLSPRIDFDERKVSSKDVVFVIDVSGSMAGNKLKQAKEALRFGLTRTLGENDRFNIIVFSSDVQPMSPVLMRATRANIERAVALVNELSENGGTNINDALVTAMRMVERGNRAQNVVFVTDGQPSAAITDPNQIAANVRAANTANARLFTFGVGTDINRLLLEKLASENRGATSHIADQSKLKEDVSTFFANVSQPVLSSLQLDLGPVLADRIHPRELPDLYKRSQIRIFGRYKNAEDLRDVSIFLRGVMNEQAQNFEFSGLNFPLATEDKDFLPKLWAGERVAALLSEIRLYGEKAELKDEVIALARQFNLVTPYTSMYVPTTAEIEAEKAGKDDQPVSLSQSGEGSGRGTGPLAQNAIKSKQVDNLPVNGRNYVRLAQLSPGVTSQGAAPQGAVVDSNGAVVPNATVTIRDQNTGVTRQVATDASGNYSVAGLPPGTYNVEVDAPGFNKTIVNNMVVSPGQITGAGVVVSPGSVSEAVTVMAGASLVQRDTAQITVNHESRMLRDLPSLAPVDSLARLSVGATSQELKMPSASSPGTDRNAEFRFWFNGNGSRSTSFSIDGRDNDDIDGRPAISVNNFDSIESLYVMTTRGTGDATLTGASSVDLQTRSGTNEFHGTAFDFHLNRRLSAMSPLERRSGLDRPPLLRNNRYGGTFGGPLRRDRMFFFGAFEGEAESSVRFIDSTSSLLTPTGRGLESLAAAFPTSPTIRDLIRRGPLARQIGSPQTSRTFLIPVFGVPVEFGQTTRLIESTAEGYEATGRFDFVASLQDTIRAGYWFSTRSATNDIGRLASGYAGASGARAQFASLQWTRTISPQTVNEASFAFHRSRLSLDANSNDQSPGVSAGLRGLDYGPSAFLPSSHASTLYEAADTLTLIVGSHNLTLGGQWRSRAAEFDYLPGRQGQYSFATFEDFTLGRPSTIAAAIGDPRSQFSQSHHHYFFDDVWRVKNNLSLSMGLSYENASQPINALARRLRERESDPSSALFDSSLPLTSPVIAGLNRDKNNFAPRLGFAYTPRFFVFGRDLFGFDKTVIRGGAQLSYDQTAFRPLAEVAASAPARVLAVITPDLISTLPEFPTALGASDLRSLLGSDPLKYARTDFAADFRTPYSAVWNLTISREIKGRSAIEASYTGSRGSKLIRATDGNPSPGGSEGPLRIYETSGRSIYHALQTRADIRATSLLEGGLSYTLSKLIDDVPDNSSHIIGSVGDRATLASGSLLTFAQNPFDNARGERGLSSLDRRHSLAGHFVLTFPWRRDQGGVLGRVLGGWKASGIIQAASGSPFTPVQQIGYRAASFAAIFSDRQGAVRPFAGNAAAPFDAVAFSNAANRALHLFLNSDGTPFISPTGFIIGDRRGFRAGSTDQARFIYNDYVVEQMARALGLSADAFGNTFAAGRAFGDIGRNTLTGPRFASFDFALLKTTKLTEKVQLQFRAEYYNLFNHPNRPRPNSIVENAGGFGFLDLGEADALPRRARFALKLIF